MLEHTESPAVDATVVGHDAQIGRTVVEQSGGEYRRNSTSPNPPTAIVEPSAMSATAAAAESNTLFIDSSLFIR